MLHTVISNMSTSSYLRFFVGVVTLSRTAVSLASHFTQILSHFSTYHNKHNKAQHVYTNFILGQDLRTHMRMHRPHPLA